MTWSQLLTEEVEAELKEEAEEVLGGSTDTTNEAALESLVPDTQLPHIQARLINHTKITKLISLKSSYYGNHQLNSSSSLVVMSCE